MILSVETQLQANKPELYNWLAFTLQKVQELSVIKTALEQGRDAVKAELIASQNAAETRKNSSEIHRTEVAQRLANLPVGADQSKITFRTTHRKTKCMAKITAIANYKYWFFPTN